MYVNHAQTSKILEPPQIHLELSSASFHRTQLARHANLLREKPSILQRNIPIKINICIINHNNVNIALIMGTTSRLAPHAHRPPPFPHDAN